MSFSLPPLTQPFCLQPVRSISITNVSVCRGGRLSWSDGASVGGFYGTASAHTQTRFQTASDAKATPMAAATRRCVLRPRTRYVSSGGQVDLLHNYLAPQRALQYLLHVPGPSSFSSSSTAAEVGWCGESGPSESACERAPINF